MRVPASLTNSALMSCGRPARLTRSRKAGGNAYSRPQSNPTFMAASSHVIGASGLLHGVARFLDQRLDDAAQVARLPVHRELPIGARAVCQNRAHVLDLAPAPQIVHHVVDEGEQL